MPDLRSFVELVRSKRPGDLVEVTRRVRPQYETAAILTKFEQRLRSPLLLFHEVADTDFKLATNICGSKGRLALALGCSVAELTTRYAEACRAPLAPRVRDDAPVHETVLRGDEVDLGLLPRMIYHENDSTSPYITGAMAVSRDPETQRTNVSYHRLMIAGRNRTGIFMERGHLHGIHAKYARRGDAMPLAVFVGAHPAWSLGAVYSGPNDEYEIMGALQREPLEVVRCVTLPELNVPAHAELVLEGLVSAAPSVDEGPFGEFTGVSAGTFRTPEFRVEAMTFRSQPIFQDVVSGLMEHLLLPALALEPELLRVVRDAAPGVRRVTMPAPLTVYVSLEKSDDAEPKRIIDAVLDFAYVKNVVVVDADVDPSDARQVAVAKALHVQANRDVHVFDDRQGTLCDPSSTTGDGRTAKMGIDATVAKARAEIVKSNRIPREVLDAIDLKDFPSARSES